MNDQPPKGSNPKLVGFSVPLDGAPRALFLVSLKFNLKKKIYRLNDDIKYKARMGGWWEASVLENKTRTPKDQRGRRDGPT